MILKKISPDQAETSLELLNKLEDYLGSHEDFERSMSNFELLTPDSPSGKHVVITISGFLSQFDEFKSSWKGLTGQCSDITVYAYQWASQSFEELMGLDVDSAGWLRKGL